MHKRSSTITEETDVFQSITKIYYKLTFLKEEQIVKNEHIFLVQHLTRVLKPLVSVFALIWSLYLYF